MSATFPNVPDTAGVPSVGRYPAYPGNASDGISAASAVLSASQSGASAVSGDAGRQITFALGYLSAASGVVNSLNQLTQPTTGIKSINSALGSASSAASLLAPINPSLGLQVSSAVSTIKSLVGLFNQMQTAQTSTIAKPTVVKQTWGLYTSSLSKALAPDTIAVVNYQQDHRISDFPIEEGGFTTYNKVRVPQVFQVRMVKGGTKQERTDFIKAYKEIENDTNLYSVVTPEYIFPNVNIMSGQINRTMESGAGIIILDLTLQEIRLAAAGTYSATKVPAGSSMVNNGPTQTTTAPTTGTIQ